MLLSRWRWLNGVPIREHEIKTAAYAATLEVTTRPLTKREATRILEAALEAFDGHTDLGAQAILLWCAERGAVTPTTAANLVAEFRRRARDAAEAREDCAA